MDGVTKQSWSVGIGLLHKGGGGARRKDSDKRGSVSQSVLSSSFFCGAVFVTGEKLATAVGLDISELRVDMYYFKVND